jgi:L-malate glycosyltransferase
MTVAAPRRLRIFVAHPSEVLTDHLPNGDGLVSFGFLRRLAERGHDVHVAAQRVELRAPLPEGLHIYPLAPRGGAAVTDRLVFMVRMRLLFERLSRTLRFDLIHQMNPVFTGLSLSLVGTRPPLVLGTFVPRWDVDADEPSGAASPPGRPFRERLRHRLCTLQQARAAGLLIATPQALSRISRPARHRERIYEVPHGIDVTRFTERAGVPARRSVLFLANVLRRKGVFTLLDAFGAVARVMPDAELVIAGDGADLPEVRRRAAALGGFRITILGAIGRADVQPLMHQHAVYCLPSYGEPFATTVLEAMACGLPVVATDAGGLRDLVTPGGGRLVAVRDAPALAQALVDVLGDRTLQEAMGRHNRRRIETTFEVERTVDRLEAAYHAILAAELRPGARRRAIAAEEGLAPRAGREATP